MKTLLGAMLKVGLGNVEKQATVSWILKVYNQIIATLLQGLHPPSEKEASRMEKYIEWYDYISASTVPLCFTYVLLGYHSIILESII